ncbi:MAG: T9SS type A sorting domain-containing protein [Bacteroidota bacterium]
MRKITLLFFMVTCGLSAQYTITPTQKPDIGDTYSYILLDTANVINGSSGVNQVWNYTNLILPTTPTVNSIYYSDAIAVTNYSWYPGAYMAIIGPDGGFTAFDADPNNYSLNWNKIMLGGGTSTKYADPLTRYHYPLTFGSTLSDSVKFGAFDETPLGYGYIGTHLCRGEHNYTCTGSGTLNLPGGVSMPNTLKLNMVYSKLFVDSYNGDSTGYEYTEYEEYFNASSKFPVLSYTKNEKHFTYPFTSTITHTYSKRIQLNNIAVTAVTEFTETFLDVTVYPNPASIFNVMINNHDLKGNIKFELHNTLGQVVILDSQKTQISDNHLQINLSGFEPGIYFLSLKNSTGTATKKILVE